RRLCRPERVQPIIVLPRRLCRRVDLRKAQFSEVGSGAGGPQTHRRVVRRPAHSRKGHIDTADCMEANWFEAAADHHRRWPTSRRSGVGGKVLGWGGQMAWLAEPQRGG